MVTRPRFALIGAAGFVAPRHLRAIKEVGGELVVAVDKNDSVGILDSFFPNVGFVSNIDELCKFILDTTSPKIDYLSVCTPNDLHLPHSLAGLDAGLDVICEKPLAISPRCLDKLEDVEALTSHRVFPILQLRLHPNVTVLKAKLDTEPVEIKHEVELHYAVHRGPWYDRSWKGQDKRSGGISVNIGIHFFDLLLWLFGEVIESQVLTREHRRTTGMLELPKARVNWLMSMENRDLLPGLQPNRHLTIDDEELVLAPSDLHTAAYQEILAGRGLRVADARPALRAAYEAQRMELAP